MELAGLGENGSAVGETYLASNLITEGAGMNNGRFVSIKIDRNLGFGIIAAVWNLEDDILSSNQDGDYRTSAPNGEETKKATSNKSCFLILLG
ncbi:hypothetical protein JR338_10165 [Chloroflexota bacterium]|nr:hypothetical protein JR338_10165 [Chloroflexota bacterium]